MPVDETRKKLRSFLEEKSTEELKELLILDFSEDEYYMPDVEYIHAIMEVIKERAKTDTKHHVDIEAARANIHEYIQAIIDEESETGTTQEPPKDHSLQIKTISKPHKRPRFLRYAGVAAALIVLLCGTASAFGINIFQAIAHWTTETFSFLRTEDSDASLGSSAVFQSLLDIASKHTDVTAVPTWAPEGTSEACEVIVSERKDRVFIRQTFNLDGDEFTIQITIHDTVPKDYTGAYMKDEELVLEYDCSGIIHYILSNNETTCVMWTNGHVEGYIQGSLPIEDLERMIDSIYN